MTTREIQFLTGDATAPIDTGRPRLIVHVVNNIGLWGAGFTRALSNRWHQPETTFRDRYEIARGAPLLGTVQVARVDDYDDENLARVLAVVNMVAQDGVRSAARPKPLDYRALRTCLGSVRALTKLTAARASVHMPRIGCGLAGGSWDQVEALIIEELVDSGVDVYVYSLPNERGF